MNQKKESITLDIKKENIANVYLFYGEEAYKKRHYKDELKEAVTAGNMMNYAQFAGKDIDWQEIYDAAVTMPFFANKRLIVVENSDKFKAKKSEEADAAPTAQKTKEPDILEKLLTDLPETTCLAFFEEGAAKNKKVYKLVASKGVVCECNADTEADVVKWLKKGFMSEKKNVEDTTLHLMIARIGFDYDRLRTEFEKVISYTYGKETVDDSDILAITSENVESKIFDMLTAMSEKNIGRVLAKYHDLLTNKEHPLYILAMLRSQFRTMLQVAELKDQGLSTAAMSKATGRPPFAINNMKRYLEYFPRKRIEDILEEIADTDRKCKTGEVQDQVGVEILLVRFSA